MPHVANKVLAIGVLMTSGCVSGNHFIPRDADVNKYRYVAITYEGGSNDGGAIPELTQLFVRAGMRPINLAVASRLSAAGRQQLLVCTATRQSSAMQSVVTLNCQDLNHQPVYSGTGTYGMGMDVSGDVRGAARMAFEGFQKSYTDPPDVAVEEGLSETPVSAAGVAANWGRPIPGATDVLVLQQRDINPAEGGSVFDRVAAATVQLRGSSATGTAFLITRDGLALTNHHVIANQSQISAVFRDNTQLAVKVLRSSEAADVALVQIRCTDCTTVLLASADAQTGEDVLAIGNPLGLNQTVTRGIVSGFRLVEGVTWLQTDAAVNRGNSGGPLVRQSDGAAIGVVSAKLSGEGIEGLGFAITITDALRVVGIRR